jgi:hypothetical protein
MEAQELGGGENTPIQIQTFAEPDARTGAATAGNPQLLYRKKQPAGPQLWAVVFTIGGLYYFWTRVLGRSIRLPQRAHRVGSTKGHGTTTDVQTARERRLAALENANRARETMVKQAKDNGTIRERTNVSSGNSSNFSTTTMTIEERQRLNQRQMQERQKQQQLEEKKKKQRQLYLRQKAQREKEEEERRKDEELGPGWRVREDPSQVQNLLQQQETSGGYKAPSCSRKGG